MEKSAYIDIQKIEEIHWWYVVRRFIVRLVLDKYIDGRKNKVLEIGCGFGGNLELFSKYGNVDAVEMDSGAKKYAKNRGIGDIKSGYLPNNMPGYKYKFDLICLLDVLEHIDDDKKSIQYLNGQLTNKGCLLITVPAYMFMWSDHDVVNHHKRRYTRKQLANLMEENGYDIVYSTYFNTILFPIMFITRLINKIFHKKNQGDFDMPKLWINTILTKIFSIERAVVPLTSFIFGGSILFLCKKNSVVCNY